MILIIMIISRICSSAAPKSIQVAPQTESVEKDIQDPTVL